MCGICGAVSWSGFASPEAARLRVSAMLQSLAHRGPDDVGQVATDTAVLGVTRLAIRGLQDANQPIVDAESGVIAVCNGEIDNHRDLRRWLAERGRPVQRATDVAVIPGLYLELERRFRQQDGWRLRGRDVGSAQAAAYPGPGPCRANVHCFMRRRGRMRHFSPPKSPPWFRAAGFRLNLDQVALRKYLQFGIFPSPDAPFAEIRKVAPGETIQIEGRAIRRRSLLALGDS